ncbi:MAG: hypothetical protein IKY23_12515 [Lachnospiraceae bacterium]|nr:hypothetical protein [Lachnospiraceae bacterium]
MKKVWILFGVLVVILTGCNNTVNKDEQTEPYVIQTEGGAIEIEATSKIYPYAKILEQYAKEGTCYTFVRIAGLEEPVFLVGEQYINVDMWGREVCVTGKATVYVLENNKVKVLGKLQSAMPAYLLCLDQLGYLYTAEPEVVTRWGIDREKKELVAVAGAYRDMVNGKQCYKYFNEETAGKAEVTDSESVLMFMHDMYESATPVQFIPLIRYEKEWNEK